MHSFSRWGGAYRGGLQGLQACPTYLSCRQAELPQMSSKKLPLRVCWSACMYHRYGLQKTESVTTQRQSNGFEPGLSTPLHTPAHRGGCPLQYLHQKQQKRPAPQTCWSSYAWDHIPLRRPRTKVLGVFFRTRPTHGTVC